MEGTWTSAPSTSTASRASRRARGAPRSPTRRPTPRRVLRAGARAAPRRASPSPCSPSSALTGYSIEDLLLQDAVLDGVEAALADRRRRAPPTCCPCSSSARRCATATAIYNCAVVVHRGRVLGVAPKSYLPTYREFYERRQLAAGRRRARRDDPRSAATRSRSAPTCCSRPRTCPASSSTSRSARTCGSRSRRARRPRSPARPCCSTCPAARSRSAAPRTASCCAGRSRRAASPPTSTPPPGRASRRTDLSWDGQTMIYENGVAAGRDRALPATATGARSPTSTSTCCARSGMRMGTFDDNRRTHAARVGAFRTHRRSTLDPPDGRPRPAAPARALPVRARRPRPARAGLLRGLQHPGRGAAAAAARRSATPKVVIGVSGGLDSTHALIVAAQAMDRAGRPRSDILGFTLPGFATSDEHQGATRTR